MSEPSRAGLQKLNLQKRFVRIKLPAYRPSTPCLFPQFGARGNRSDNFSVSWIVFAVLGGQAGVYRRTSDLPRGNAIGSAPLSVSVSKITFAFWLTSCRFDCVVYILKVSVSILTPVRGCVCVASDRNTCRLFLREFWFGLWIFFVSDTVRRLGVENKTVWEEIGVS